MRKMRSVTHPHSISWGVSVRGPPEDHGCCLLHGHWLFLLFSAAGLASVGVFQSTGMNPLFVVCHVGSANLTYMWTWRRDVKFSSHDSQSHPAPQDVNFNTLWWFSFGCIMVQYTHRRVDFFPSLRTAIITATYV